MHKQKGTMKKVMRLIRPYLHYVVLSFVFALISALLTLYAPILIGQGVDLIVGKKTGGFFRSVSDIKASCSDHRNY